MGALTWLTKINDYLEKVPTRMDAYFAGISQSAEKMTQSEIDAICLRASWYVNVKVEGVRQKVLKTLHKQYEDYTKQLGPVSTIMSLFTNPIGALGAVISAVKSILKVLIAPFEALIQFLLDLTEEIARLAENLAKIASYSPKSVNPNLNYNKFQVKVNSVTMGDVIAGPDGLPAPEVMFPEPPAIFGKESFQNSFDEARNSFVETKKKYMIEDEDGFIGDTYKGDDRISNPIA